MRKKILLSVITVVIAITLFATLCACESYKAKPLSKVGDSKAEVQSNGGLVVKQGGYLYFVNGYSGYLSANGKDNWFGNVTKGAIVRVTYNADGSIGDDFVVVVPKSVMADSENVGFSIFGKYIYYVSPSTDEDRSGNVQTGTLQFMRTKIDGTGTQVIMEIKDTSVKYKYTSTSLVYFRSSDSKLYTKSLKHSKFDKSGKGKCIAKDVTSVYFPACDSYNPADKNIGLNDYVFYTVGAEGDYDYNNILYVCSSDGKVNKQVIGEDSYTDAKYSVNVIATSVDDGKMSVYYTKTSYLGTDSTGTVQGTFAYQFADDGFAFDASKEVKLTSASLSKVYALGYNNGLLSADGNVIIYSVDGTSEMVGEFSIDSLVAIYEGKMFYIRANYLYYYDMSGEGNVQYAVSSETKVKSDFTGAEYFDGYVYFITDDDYKYCHRVKLSDCDVYGSEDAAVTRIGIVTKSDAAKMAEAEKDSED